MKVLPYGDVAVLVEAGDAAHVLGVRDALVGVQGIVELVPAARTLLVRFDPRATDASAVRAAASAAERIDARAHDSGQVDLAVHYDGADLADVAAQVGCSVRALIDRHTAGEYTVAFCGFAPGFAYLTGLEPALQVPRLSSPRTSVPAGAVAIAGEYTGVYPRSSPGGWRLLGRTEAALWDLGRTQPALLTPGTPVRFRPL